jgi:hypothetical protein
MIAPVLLFDDLLHTVNNRFEMVYISILLLT